MKAEGANPPGNAQAKGLRDKGWLWRVKQRVYYSKRVDYKISTEGFNLNRYFN